MGIINTVRDVLQASTQSANRGEGTDDPVGSYWCDDCTERLPATEDDAEPPACPACGETMRLDRSPGTTGCAC